MQTYPENPTHVSLLCAVRVTLAALMRTLRSTTGLPLPASGLLISFACCVLSTVLLLQLSIAVTQDVQLSVLSSLLFLLSPASIFHAAMYTESLFTALTFTGLWLLHTYEPGRSAADGKAACGWKAEILWHARFWGAACAFALASCTRSNGGCALILLFMLSYKKPGWYCTPGITLTVSGCRHAHA